MFASFSAILIFEPKSIAILFYYFSYTETDIIQSNLFNELSTLEERQIFLEEILTFVLLEDISNDVANRRSNCQAHYNACSDQALRDHEIRVAGCTGTAVVAAILTGGPGAATWPICMAGSGLLWDSAMQGCRDHRDICLNQ